jgi:hypothetical protein
MRRAQPFQEIARHPRQQNLAVSSPHFMPSESETPLEFTASVKIESECWRILSALTIPEYLEAWLETPDGEGIVCHSESSAFAKFRINFLNSSANRSVINVSRIQSRPDTITLIWENYQFGKITTSTVDILVRSGPRRCTLILKHTGFRSINELDWYSNVWNLSLSKLCRLMESLRAFP